MKLKVQHVVDATVALTTIINERRPMPQRGKYFVARMHSKLLVEFNVAQARRDEMIKAYDTPQMREVPGQNIAELLAAGKAPDMEPAEGQWQVPADKMPEFNAAWKVIGDEEIDVDVTPIPLSAVSLPDGSDGSIQAHELIALGELITE